MKRIISVIISISLLLMSVPAFAISGSGTESNPYLISSASDIAKIHNDLDGYYKLTTNINMSGVDFEPIGNESEGPFTGTIDGNGYTISNININLPENKYVGFVGYLEGTVMNLTLTSVDALGYRYVGGIVGYADAIAQIDSCVVSGSVVGEFDTLDNVNVGGIVGYGESDIRNCENNADVTASSTNVLFYDAQAYAGGIVGNIVSGNIYNSTNCGNVYSSVMTETDSWTWYTASAYSGGIAGSSSGNISNSNNKGNVSGYSMAGSTCGTGYGVSADYSRMYIGGIVGSASGEISYCDNNGDALNHTASDTTYTYSGGIAGYSTGVINLCNNFYNESTLNNYSIIVGGIVGYNVGNVMLCYNNNDISVNTYGFSYAGGIAGVNSGKVINNINSANISSKTLYSRLGGIAGSNNGIVQYCSNYGKIFCTSTSSTYDSYYYSWLGGIVGTNDNEINNCINYGMISGKSYTRAAGISGNSVNKISYCINIAPVTGSISGGIISSDIEIDNCYQLDNTKHSKYNFNLLSYDELKNITSFPDFDFENNWSVGTNYNSGFPELNNLPEHIELNESIEVIEVGDTDRLYAYIDGSSESVTWSTDDSSIATVSSSGTIEAKSIGTTMVTATNEDGMKANCLIYVYGKATYMELSESEININRDSTYTLSALQVPGSANETVMWYSEDETVAKVDQAGVVTGVSKGTTKVYAISTSSKLRAECIVNVSSPITTISLSSSYKTIKLGDSDILTATLSPSDYEGSITWSSLDESVASVDQNGKISTHKIGTTYIIATASSGISSRCEVTVNQPATSIKLNKTSLTTYVGTTYQLSATVLPADTSDTITWYSSDPYYASVSNTGLVTANVVYHYGSIAITAQTSSGLSATCYVTVKPTQIMPTAVTLSDTYITLAPEDAKVLTPTFEPSNTTETTLVWTSSDESVATVDKNGVVTAVSNGFATIRGKTTNGLTSECVVKVVSATGTSVLLDNTKASPGGAAQVKANIVKNPGLSAYKFKVNYDADVLTPVSITPNAEFGGTFSTNLEDANRTELNVLWYSGNDDVVANGELFIVNFKVNDSAAYGDSSIVSIEYGATDVCDVSGNYIAIYTEDATVSIEEPMPGDIYEDSDVNVYDLTLLARYITSLETFTERQEEAADVNNDERVDILDVIRLAQYLVKWSGIELLSLDLYDEPTTPVISVGSASVNESNEAEIPVYIKNNSGILGYRFVLDYNAEDIEILSITPSELINKDGFNHNLCAESQATDGLVVSCYASGNNITDDGVLFTIKVRYKNPADTSVSPIRVVDSFDNLGNENATYVTATYETGYVLGSDYIVANKVVGDTNFSCELYFDASYAEQSAKAIIAFYDGDGRMVQLMPKDITVKPGKVDLSIDYDKKAYTTYKLMIWEGLNSLKPITVVK